MRESYRMLAIADPSLSHIFVEFSVALAGE
jgi:hypothetical protein